MEYKYLNASSLKRLVHSVMTGIDPECDEDQLTLCSILPSFHACVDAVITGEMHLLLDGQVPVGEPFRKMVLRYDQARHSSRETAVINVRVLNRLADLYSLPSVFTGNGADRRQVEDFCMELDQYLFGNRRQKLS